MKRRKFFVDMGLGIGSGLLSTQVFSMDPSPSNYPYPGIKSLADATNEQGELALRFALTNNGRRNDQKLNLKIKISGTGNLTRTKSYFLEPPDQTTPNEEGATVQVYPGDVDVLVAWIESAVKQTICVVSTGTNKWRFNLSELLTQGELRFENNVVLTVNLLGYNEVGKLELSELGLKDKNNFRLAIMADPQGGNPETPDNDSPTRMKIHNAFIEETVDRIKELNPQPEFTLILGDFVDSKGQKGNFEYMEKLVRPLKMPVLLEVGNHETPYKADFSPAYNMSDLNNFFTSQKRINGTTKILYSFNMGNWHFVVWPDPLRSNFWENHPHYFDWLENDLSQHRNLPTIFLQHVPMHPIGIDPLTSYVESISVKQVMMDILSKYGTLNMF